MLQMFGSACKKKGPLHQLIQASSPASDNNDHMLVAQTIQCARVLPSTKQKLVPIAGLLVFLQLAMESLSLNRIMLLLAVTFA